MISILKNLALASLLLVSIVSCRTVKTVPVETVKTTVKHDTLIVNQLLYDSIYVNHDKLTDRSHDTILIKETITEYRYRLLRDTVYRTKVEIQRDSIPYEVKVVETKEVKYTPWYAKTLAWIGVVCLVLIVLYVVLKFVVKR